jgi:hypothetical protein
VAARKSTVEKAAKMQRKTMGKKAAQKNGRFAAAEDAWGSHSTDARLIFA